VKFEIRYPTGAPHEVTLQGTVAILGRDPSCDLVLNDPRCSRRHAVIEAGPQGLTIRDTGSANGVIVNGEKVERSGLKPGDEVRLGEIALKVLKEEMPGTVVMAPEEMVDFPDAGPAAAPSAPSAPPPSVSPNTASLPPVSLPPQAAAPPPPAPRPPAPAPPRPAPAPPAAQRPAAPPPRPAPPPRAAAPSRPPSPPPRREAQAAEEDAEAPEGQGPIPRSTAITVLAVLWALGVLSYAGLGVWLAVTGEGMVRGAGVALGGLLALVSAAMAFGLWTRSGWARSLQIALAALGILGCVFAPVSIAILFYMLRADTRLQFSGQDLAELPPEDAERAARDAPGLPFAATFLGTLLLSLLLAGGAWALVSTLGMGIASFDKVRAGASQAVAITELRVLASAQEAFRAGTCDGYASLDALLNPSSAIPNYPAGGPAFLPTQFAQPERNGYRFELTVDDPLPEQDGCPNPIYRRYAYAAAPASGSGKHFMIGPDGMIHAAYDRPAGADDPPALE
jgi:hypothetical protein